MFKNLLEQKKTPEILMDKTREDFLETMGARAGQF